MSSNASSLASEDNMHRSASHSAARSSDEFSVNFPSSALMKGFDSNQNLLADYDDEYAICDGGESKKEKPSPGERAVHLIPMVLIFCGFVLWWFSHPVHLH